MTSVAIRWILESIVAINSPIYAALITTLQVEYCAWDCLHPPRAFLQTRQLICKGPGPGGILRVNRALCRTLLFTLHPLCSLHHHTSAGSRDFGKFGWTGERGRKPGGLRKTVAGVNEERVDWMIGRPDDWKTAMTLSENTKARSMRLVLRLARASSCVFSMPSFPVSFSLRPAVLFALLLLLSSHSDLRTLSKNRKTFDRISRPGSKPDASKGDEMCQGKSRVDCPTQTNLCSSWARVWMGWLALRLGPLFARHLFLCSSRRGKTGSRSAPRTNQIGGGRRSLDSCDREEKLIKAGEESAVLEMDESGKGVRREAPLDDLQCTDVQRLQNTAFAKLRGALYAFLLVFYHRLID
jgi:hypothetical protein